MIEGGRERQIVRVYLEGMVKEEESQIVRVYHGGMLGEEERQTHYNS